MMMVMSSIPGLMKKRIPSSTPAASPTSHVSSPIWYPTSWYPAGKLISSSIYAPKLKPSRITAFTWLRFSKIVGNPVSSSVVSSSSSRSVTSSIAASLTSNSNSCSSVSITVPFSSTTRFSTITVGGSSSQGSSGSTTTALCSRWVLSKASPWWGGTSTRPGCHSPSSQR